ncbi:MAG: sigma 54-interacting transcriptional regulator [Deltaproteobacteria bacterium]|nr:sigma 54-interacting transcriptional regulator [Deltaproteobacteria bacterium]
MRQEHSLPPSDPRAQGGAQTDRIVRPEGPGLALRAGSEPPLRLGFREVAVGRDALCDLVLSDRSVSSHHATIRRDAEGWELIDEGSTNGTTVDNVRVTRARLREGQLIVFGRVPTRCLSTNQAPTLMPMALTDDELAGESEWMADLRRELSLAANTPYAVLIRGESGSGKELAARAIHRYRARADAPLIALNAGAIPETLIESELFGHEKGAFTGANMRRRGAFEQAHQGTLFLDEIADLPLAQQTRLLRVLETGELRRVGSEETLRVSVKLVCATHMDLEEATESGRFRRDLLSRLQQHVVTVPPLRDRIEDLPLLTYTLCQRVSRELHRAFVLEERALAVLMRHDWPGNVRELLAVLRAAAARAPEGRIGPEHLGDFQSRGRALRRSSAPPPPPQRPTRQVSEPSLRATHHRIPSGPALLALLHAVGGSIAALSRTTGMSRAALRARIQKATAELQAT